MRTKTILELLTLSTSLYHLAKETQLIDRFNEISDKGKDSLNHFASEKLTDEDGNEMEFIDKVIFKTAQAKQELEDKIEELIVKFYQKVNIAHTDEILALKDQLEKCDQAIALLEARVNHIEAKK
ncbi:MAG: hypothetical protein KJO49_02980 [Bacteroidia bacterium]|nr:hypothetical protein [Bacteroidia bacterium]MBT8269519.1 hypothetical protein [Bacteroidia bacterium]NNF83278.1 hypothetical protein [Flavobacteriaceae bacterium]NNK69825.1 hypothetical protein [Flavobacteriaceae bacterium]NNL79761.1 hypothetical protein [Flavobacteriaceae bacterium]